ncbi:hypothetical protein [Foetidibacter luteolus]|uniref:hypothetical protein n=1 Tax=Foetidibacter luteolus TaxID=2608880 RepID=UPI00129AA25D|nr:hypothetical protein [Foetidibacter luteolus]
MKVKIWLAAVVLSVTLFSCLDTEEKIVIKSDDSGTYSLNVDMGRMMQYMKAFASQKEEIQEMLKAKDTTILFSSFIDTVSQLTAQEKEMLHDGSLNMRVDEENDEMKLSFLVPFKNIAHLQYLKQHFPEMLGKLKAADKAMGGDGNKQAMSGNANPGGMINPAAQAYSFSAEKNSISNRLVDKAALESVFSGDTLQMVKQALPMMGDMNYKTVFVLYKPVKSFNGANATTSEDKKTVTFSSSLSKLFEQPEAFEYKLEY